MGDLLREGLVASVDHDAGTCTVDLSDDLTTGPVPFLSPRMGNVRVWLPPAIGEQVLVLAPEGDTARGIVIGGLASDARPQVGRGPGAAIEFGDGARLAYDPQTHGLTITLPAGGTAAIVADGGLSLKGPLSVEGAVDITGKLTASDDVVGGGKSLKGHIHDKVQPGQGVSGKPV
ncbi:phage baseplate assembly protein V [Sphingomonas sanguinis]|uniref:phage baseplate assembly protein V n=1 Tax=Sphingomonas sanguinis TaxID=33051 RepID=UPI00214C01C2|nr:phage baseplate assembly protein V [Sphingomonas sanguinis]